MDTYLAPFAFHPEPESYLKALTSWVPGAAVPVLGEPTAAAAAVAALGGAGPRPVVPEHGEIAVFWPRGSGAGELGAALATAVEARGGEIADVDEIGPRSSGAEHVALVCLADELDERMLIRVHESLWREHGERRGGHFGLVVGDDLGSLSWIVAKGLALPHRSAPEQEHVRIWPAAQSIPRRYGRGQWLLRDDAGAKEIRPLLLERYSGAISFLAHGRDDVVHFNDTVVCPIGPRLIEPDSPAAAHAPVCAFTGHCYRPEVADAEIVLAGDIRADFVFANSCMGMRVNEGLYPREYLMPHGFVGGVAAAYLATGQVIVGLLKLNDLFHSALDAGLTVGQAASVVNDHLRYERVDLPYYTLLGLPWLSAAGVLPEPGEAWLEYRTELGDPQATGGGMRAAAVALAAAEGSDESPHVLFLSPRTAALLPDEVLARPSLGALPPLAARLRGIGRTLANLENVAFTGLRYSRQGNMLVNVRDQVASLAQALHHAALRGDVKRISRRIDAITRGMERAELALAEALFERGIQSFQHYNDIWGETLELHGAELTDRECAYCDRPLTRQAASHPILERIGRDSLICPRCGMISDRDALSPVSDLDLRTPEQWRCGEEREIRLSFTVRSGDSDREPPSRVTAGVFIANAAKYGISFPAPRVVEVGPDGSGSLELSVLTPHGARTHQEYVRGFVVAEGTISFLARPVWIRPGSRSEPIPVSLLGSQQEVAK